MKTENSLQTAVRWTFTGIAVAGFGSVALYVLSWPMAFFVYSLKCLRNKEEAQEFIENFASHPFGLKVFFALTGMVVLFTFLLTVGLFSTMFGIDLDVLSLIYYVWAAPICLFAAITIFKGLAQSVNAESRGVKNPPVRGRTLWIVLFMLGGAILFLQLMLVAAQGIDPYLSVVTYRILLTCAVFVALRAAFKAVIGNRAGLATHAAAVVAILCWPIYASLFYKAGLPMALYDIAKAVVDTISM